MILFCGRSAPALAPGPFGHVASMRSPVRIAALNVSWSCFERPGSSVPTVFLPGSFGVALSVCAGAGADAESVDAPAVTESGTVAAGVPAFGAAVEELALAA